MLALSEKECWSHAAASIKNLSTMYTRAETIETIGKANRLISVWPTDDNIPVDGIRSVETNYKRLSLALNEIRTTAGEETK